jgi:hypothetical protein
MSEKGFLDKNIKNKILLRHSIAYMPNGVINIIVPDFMRSIILSIVSLEMEENIQDKMMDGSIA